MLSGDELYGDEITSPLYRSLINQLVDISTAEENETSWDDDMPSFDEWMDRVNEIISNVCEGASYDISGMGLQESYEANTPEEFCLDNFGIEDGKIVDKRLFRTLIKR